MTQLKKTHQTISQNPISVVAYLQFIGEISQINARKEAALIQRISKDDNNAYEALVKAKLGLVVSIAKQYRHMGLSLHHLIMEGNLGLVSAVKRFANDKEVNFTIYATGWIRQSILQAITEHFWISKLSLSENGIKPKIDKVLHQLNSNFRSEPIVFESSDR
ncbi:hypothetical protein MASR2M47_24840 [Draconibacterium sp.]|jgi:RNA polymerase primary sigma factor